MPVWRTAIILSFVFAERDCISRFSFYWFSRWMINGCAECLLTSELGNCVIVCGRLEPNGFKIQRSGREWEECPERWEDQPEPSKNWGIGIIATHTHCPSLRCVCFWLFSRRNGICLKWRNRTGELLKEGIICNQRPGMTELRSNSGLPACLRSRIFL